MWYIGHTYPALVVHGSILQLHPPYKTLESAVTNIIASNYYHFLICFRFREDAQRLPTSEA